MKNEYDNSALLRAIVMDSEALLELLFELPKRLGVGPIVGGALASADALISLLNAISSEEQKVRSEAVRLAPPAPRLVKE